MNVKAFDGTGVGIREVGDTVGNLLLLSSLSLNTSQWFPLKVQSENETTCRNSIRIQNTPKTQVIMLNFSNNLSGGKNILLAAVFTTVSLIYRDLGEVIGSLVSGKRKKNEKNDEEIANFSKDTSLKSVVSYPSALLLEDSSHIGWIDGSYIFIGFANSLMLHSE